MPEIVKEKCNLCGLCVEVCHCGALVLASGTVNVVETENCHWCTICEAICPTGALTCAFEIVIED